jgi:site-specific DNA recombinase
MAESKKVAVYTRSATAQQEESLHNYCADYGYSNVRSYVDKGASGNTLDRPAFNQLNADIDAGEIDTVVVENLSRISRNVGDLLNWVDNVKQKGVSLVSVIEGVQ